MSEPNQTFVTTSNPSDERPRACSLVLPDTDSLKVAIIGGGKHSKEHEFVSSKRHSSVSVSILPVLLQRHTINIYDWETQTDSWLSSNLTHPRRHTGCAIINDGIEGHQTVFISKWHCHCDIKSKQLIWIFYLQWEALIRQIHVQHWPNSGTQSPMKS